MVTGLVTSITASLAQRSAALRELIGGGTTSPAAASRSGADAPSAAASGENAAESGSGFSVGVESVDGAKWS